MNDIDALKALLTRAKIEFDYEDNSSDPEKNHEVVDANDYRNNQHDRSFVISVERGYSGFVTVFTFDKNGNLIDMGAFE